MTEAGQPLIQIQDMTKVFYTDEIETHALSGVHLSDRQGRVRGDVGAIGLRQVDAAVDHRPARYADRRTAISLNGKTVENLDFAERSRIRNQEIGFIFQSFNLIGDLTVYENVELPLTYRQKMPARRAQEARDGSAGARRHGASRAALSVAALRRSAAARRRGARAGRKAFDPAG